MADIVGTPSSDSLAGRSPPEMEVDNSSTGNTPSTPETLPLLGSKLVEVATPSGEVSDDSILSEDEDEGAEYDDEIILDSKKRKRAVSYISTAPTSSAGPGRHAKKRQGPEIRGVPIGVWTDSSEPDDQNKHVIYGFIDSNDRIRTRIYAMNKRKEELIGNFPIGAGGCWVKFAKVIFDPHLTSLSGSQIKEYVRIRSEDIGEETPDEKQKADQKAVAEAITTASDEFTTPGAPPVLPRKPSYRPVISRELQRRGSSQKSGGFQAINAADTPTPKNSSIPKIDGKPNGVLLGYWSGSSEIRVEDKHAVYGVVGENDNFRTKVQKITRDGRYIEGNFPVGTGAYWLSYDALVLEPQLKSLTRPEIKRYCKIRQRDMEGGETEQDKAANEAAAIHQAKANVAATESQALEQNGGTEPEIRQSARPERKKTVRNQAEVESPAANLAHKKKLNPQERQQEKTRKELAKAKALGHAFVQEKSHKTLKHLDKIWLVQEESRSQSSSTSPTPLSSVETEIKYHNGIKYERKATGPFQGKLVSSAQILSIDGEDFVEYRVLAKPSF